MRAPQEVPVGASGPARAIINFFQGVAMPPEMPSAESSVAPAVAPGPRPTTDLLGRSVDELRAWMTHLGEPAYRGAQLYHALYAKRRRDFASMTNIPVALRTRLDSDARIGLPEIARRYQSADGSVRYLLSLGDDSSAASGRAPSTARVEAVFMPSEGAKRFVFRRRRAVPSIAIFASRLNWG
jgi:hypothetical protein